MLRAVENKVRYPVLSDGTKTLKGTAVDNFDDKFLKFPPIVSDVAMNWVAKNLGST